MGSKTDSGRDMTYIRKMTEPTRKFEDCRLIPGRLYSEWTDAGGKSGCA